MANKTLSAAARLQCRMNALHLKDGVMSATDAAQQAGMLIFEASDALTSSHEKEIWREYDAAITKLTIEMLNKL